MLIAPCALTGALFHARISNPSVRPFPVRFLVVPPRFGVCVKLGGIASQQVAIRR